MNKLTKFEVTEEKAKRKSALMLGVALPLLAFVILINTQIVLAGSYPPADADALWANIANFVGTWVFRLGGVVLFVGGILFALGWRSDDAEQKSKGVGSMIAGGMVMGLSALVGVFFGTP